jgi:glyoxylase-like metal-dependent hydrolase (beta-lactamase superfamily II)
MNTWVVGDMRVTQVVEMPVEIGLLDWLIEEATPEAVNDLPWLRPDYATAGGQTKWSLHSYVVDTGSTVVLVDTCCGNDKSAPLLPAWGGLNNPYLERLRDAGYEPEQVGFVLGTHLHGDHVGWNTSLVDGKWQPTFRNATYTYVRDEYGYHRGLAEVSGVPDLLQEQTRLVFQESIQPCDDAGLLRLVPANHVVTEGVRYVSTPGHTRSHHSVMLESRGERAFITGDFIHHPVQIRHPRWSSVGDYDGSQSAAERIEFIEANADSDLLILGTHFAGSSAGRIVRDGDGYRFAPMSAS